MSLLASLGDARLVIVAGPGGVGKTTSAAAIAVALARSGRRTRVLTADPARRLHDALGERAAHEPRLSAGMIESSRAFAELLPRMVPDASARRSIERSPVFQRFARSLARSHAYATLEVLHDALFGPDSASFDVVVLDTPPMRGVLDLMDAPAALGRFAGSSAVDLFARPDGPSGWALSRVLGLLLGVELARGLGEFIGAFAPFRGGFAERAEAVLGALGGCASVLVTSGDAARIADAAALADALGARGAQPTLLLGNMVLARTFPAWSLEALPSWPDAHREPLEAALRLGQSARAAEAEARRSLEALAARLDCPLVLARARPREPVGPDALEGLVKDSVAVLR
jgi:hypothetical protein